MKVLVAFAVDAEFAPWRALRDFRRSPVVSAPVWESQTGAIELRVVLTGMGPGRAAQAGSVFLDDRPDVCISSGFAGALRPGHRPGEILAAREVSLAGSGPVVRSDESLYQLALLCGAKPVGRFHTSATVLRSAREKASLGAAADAVEMESFFVLAEAARREVPAVAIRAVSDAADEDLPLDFAQVVNERGAVSLPRLMAQIARSPWSLPGVVRFGRESRRSATLLAGFLERCVGTLAERAEERSEVVEEVAAT